MASQLRAALEQRAVAQEEKTKTQRTLLAQISSLKLQLTNKK